MTSGQEKRLLVPTSHHVETTARGVRRTSKIARSAAALGHATQSARGRARQLEVLSGHEALRDDPSGRGASRESVAFSLLELGRFDEAEAHCNQSIEIRKRELSPNDPDADRGEQCLLVVLKRRKPKPMAHPRAGPPTRCLPERFCPARISRCRSAR